MAQPSAFEGNGHRSAQAKQLLGINPATNGHLRRP
jgi:hypothetical protein